MSEKEVCMPWSLFVGHCVFFEWHLIKALTCAFPLSYVDYTDTDQSVHSAKFAWITKTELFHGKICNWDICGQHMPRSTCAFAQSDQGLRCLFNESLDIGYVKSQTHFRLFVSTVWPGIYCSHVVLYSIQRFWRWADSEDPDQTARTRSLIWVFAVHECHKFPFSDLVLIWC